MDDNPDIENELPERAYEMDANLVENVQSFIETQDKDGLVALFNQYHAADIADLFEQIDPISRSALKFTCIWDIHDVEVARKNDGATYIG